MTIIGVWWGFTMDFYSQFGQDKWLYENVFNDKVDGVFVEFGALDGIFHSNTYFFEKYLNWTGLCIEPNPTMYKELIKNRTCRNVNSAVFYKNSFVDFVKIEGPVRGWGGIFQSMEPEHLKRIANNVDDSLKSVIQVPSKTLEAILVDENTYNIDYMSIDVEGAEADILLAFPFEMFNVDVISVEVSYGDTITSILGKRGYTKITRLGEDNIYRKVV